MRLVFLACLVIMGVSSCKNSKPQDASHTDLESEKEILREDSINDQAHPILEVVEGAERNLGKIREGIKTNVIFTLINKGEADASNISIHDLSEGGCEAISLISKLSVGDSAIHKSIFETLGYGGRKETRKIMVRYDNPSLSPMTLSVTAEVLPIEAHQVPIRKLEYNYIIMLDIREEAAFKKGHIAGAIHIPEKEVLSWVSALPRYFTIYIYSKDGAESDAVAKQLQSNGFKEVLSIVGGIDEWKRVYGERVIIEGQR